MGFITKSGIIKNLLQQGQAFSTQSRIDTGEPFCYKIIKCINGCYKKYSALKPKKT